MRLVDIPVTTGAVALVHLDPRGQILVGGLQRILHVRRPAVYSRIKRGHGYLAFKRTNRHVRARVNKAHAHVTERCQQKDYDSRRKSH